MKPFQANIVNALVLIGLGLWGYLSSTDPSPTALIAPISGVLLLAMTPGVRTENKVIAHIAVLLTLLLLVALFMPFMAREGIAKMRVGIMMFSCLIALVVFIKSFIDARKAREAGQ